MPERGWRLPSIAESESSLALERRQDDGIMGVSKAARTFPVEFQPMTPEEIERAMQFVLRQQAQFERHLRDWHGERLS
jgi:hypothetical protein